MTDESRVWQFWLNFGVQTAVALATFLAALVALFGERWRARLFPPRLALRLVPGFGVSISRESLEKVKTPARYHHVRATNNATWPQAKRAQVYMTRVESKGPDGEMRSQWTGNIPILWQYQEAQPLTRPLGPPFDCTLCSVTKGGFLELWPLIAPFNFSGAFEPPVDIVVTLQIRSDDGVSPERSFRTSWDGQWHDGDREMADHFVVRDVGDIGTTGGK